jgi:hypothetical protein
MVPLLSYEVIANDFVDESGIQTHLNDANKA